MLCVTVAVLQEAGLFFFWSSLIEERLVWARVYLRLSRMLWALLLSLILLSLFFSPFFFFELMLLPSCVSESFVWIQSKGISGGELSRFWIKLCAWMDAVFNGVICICRCSDRSRVNLSRIEHGSVRLHVAVMMQSRPANPIHMLS